MKPSIRNVLGGVALALVVAMPAMAEDDAPVFGHQLMTQEELQEHHRMMQSLDTPEARQEYREQHHERMLERARERGVTLPEEPGPHGKGMGMGKGMGKGNGQGMGSGMGPGMGQGKGQ